MMMAHPAKIQRQRSLNNDYPDEFDYQNVYAVDNAGLVQDPYPNSDYPMEPVTSRLEIPYSTGSIRRQPESILKNGHGSGDANGSTPRSGLNPDLGPEGSVAGSSYRSSSDGFDRGSYYPAKKSSVCSSRGVNFINILRAAFLYKCFAVLFSNYSLA